MENSVSHFNHFYVSFRLANNIYLYRSFFLFFYIHIHRFNKLRMKREVSSRTSFYKNDVQVHGYNVSSLPPQIDCHLCWDNSHQHRGSSSSVKDTTSEHAVLLYSSNIGYIVHTPPPPPPPSIVCYCSSCCSTYRYVSINTVFILKPSCS